MSAALTEHLKKAILGETNANGENVSRKNGNDAVLVSETDAVGHTIGLSMEEQCLNAMKKCRRQPSERPLLTLQPRKSASASAHEAQRVQLQFQVKTATLAQRGYSSTSCCDLIQFRKSHRIRRGSTHYHVQKYNRAAPAVTFAATFIIHYNTFSIIKPSYL